MADSVQELVQKLVEIMIDPSRAPGAAPASVDERNATRKEAGDSIISCVEFLCSQLRASELEDEIDELHEKYLPGNIDEKTPQ